ncbi:MAG: MBL fold metallo-hydrolase [Pseudomonadota bacterium]
MSFKITTLCENTVPISAGLIGEHGISFTIEHDGAAVLFDTGQGMGLLDNAVRLGKDLSAVDVVILSHGHYDHTGGLPAVFAKSPGVKLVAHPDIFQEKMGVLPGKEPKAIGLPLKRTTIEKNADLILTTGPWSLSDRIMTTGEVPMKAQFEKIDAGLFVRSNGELMPDEMRDDLSLILKTEAGVVVVLGCCHRGVVNTMTRAKELTGEDRVHALIGGMHLERASPEQLEATMSALDQGGVEIIAVSHCTGLEAAAKMRAALGPRVTFNRVGSVFEF